MFPILGMGLGVVKEMGGLWADGVHLRSIFTGELPDPSLRQALAHLQAAEFFYETHIFPDLEYTFKHALTHQVAYGSLLQERRRALHARIVAAMERLYPDRLAEQVDRLASHALRGELWDKALSYFHQAGARNAARAGYREAVACFEQARVALGQLPKSRDTMEAAVSLCFDLRTAFNALGSRVTRRSTGPSGPPLTSRSTPG